MPGDIPKCDGKLSEWSILGHPQESNRKKGLKIANLAANDNQKLQICTDTLFCMGNSMVTSTFDVFQYLTDYGAPQGSNEGPKGSKLSISPQIMIRSWKFAQVFYFT